MPAVFFIRRPAAPLYKVIRYGLVLFGLQFGFLFVGMYMGVAPGIASILMQSNVFFTIFLGILLFKERPHIWQLLGALVAFTGITMVGIYSDGDVKITGFVLVLLAAISWSVGTVFSKKVGRVNMISLVVWGSLFAWPPLLATSYLLEGQDRIVHALTHMGYEGIGAIIFITYAATLLCFAVWNWLIHHHPISSVAPFTLLVPIVALCSSSLVLEEPLQNWKISAAVLVIIGLSINLIGPKIAAYVKHRRLF